MTAMSCAFPFHYLPWGFQVPSRWNETLSWPLACFGFMHGKETEERWQLNAISVQNKSIGHNESKVPCWNLCRCSTSSSLELDVNVRDEKAAAKFPEVLYSGADPLPDRGRAGLLTKYQDCTQIPMLRLGMSPLRAPLQYTSNNTAIRDIEGRIGFHDRELEPKVEQVSSIKWSASSSSSRTQCKWCSCVDRDGFISIRRKLKHRALLIILKPLYLLQIIKWPLLPGCMIRYTPILYFRRQGLDNCRHWDGSKAKWAPPSLIYLKPIFDYRDSNYSCLICSFIRWTWHMVCGKLCETTLLKSEEDSCSCGRHNYNGCFVNFMRLQSKATCRVLYGSWTFRLQSVPIHALLDFGKPIKDLQLSTGSRPSFLDSTALMHSYLSWGILGTAFNCHMMS